MRIELNKGKQWYYRLVAGNNKILLTSETYRTKWNARRAAKKLATFNNLTYKEVA